jgi:hypothetical protein
MLHRKEKKRLKEGERGKKIEEKIHNIRKRYKP